MRREVGATYAALAVAAWRWPGPVLAAAVMATLLAALAAGRLRLEADLTALLPASFDSMRDLRAVQRHVGGIGYVAVVVRGDDPASVRRHADALAARLEALPALRWVDSRRPVAFFRRHALYFLTPEALAGLEDLVLHVRPEDWVPASPSGASIVPPELLDAPHLTRLLGPAEGDRYASPDGRAVALLAKPDGVAGDLDVSRRVVGEVGRVVAELSPAARAASVRVELAGRYKRKVDQRDLIVRGLRTATAAAVLLVLGYLALHFRRAVALPLVLAPLACALLWAAAGVALAFGSVSLLTAFMAALMAGIGVDHGLHLLASCEREIARRGPGEDAIRYAFSTAGGPVLVAGLTTAVGFAAFSLSEYRAFREFGVAAAAAISLVVVSYAIWLPPLLRLTRARVGAPPAAAAGRLLGRRPAALARPVLVATLLAVTGALCALPAVRFDADFAHLEGDALPSYRTDRLVDRLLGRSQLPVYVLVEDRGDEVAVAAALRERAGRQGSTIDMVLAGSDLVPPQQADKQEVLRRIGGRLATLDTSGLGAGQRVVLARLQAACEAPPFAYADLPRTLRRRLGGTGEAATRAGWLLVFPAVRSTDGAAVRRLAREIRSVSTPSGRPVRAAAELMVLADSLDLVLREAPVVLLATGLGVLLVLWLALGGLSGALTCLGTAATSLLLLLGLLPACELQLNYLNMLLLPVLFGMGVDGAVHLVTGVRRGLAVEEVLQRCGREIAGALLTSMLAFGALVPLEHPGLASTGRLALLGLCVSALTTLVLLPVWLAWRSSGTCARLPGSQPGPRP